MPKRTKRRDTGARAIVINKLESIAREVYDRLADAEIPGISLPVRSKTNIVFDEQLNVWKYGDSISLRTAKTLEGAQSLLRTMCTIEFLKEQLNAGKSSTLREMYYISEGWKYGKFPTQQESDRLVEDLEIYTKCMREDFRLRPEENGASIIGNITIEETIRTGETRKINCSDDVGDAGYTIPYNVERDKIRFKSWDADIILAIETGGMFDRLVENGFDETARAILVHLKGQPARCTRRLIKRMNEECKLPVIVFTDGDPWSYRIFASIAYGAIKTAHISEYLATPSALFLGVLPSDIENYKLPSDKLTNEDINALKAELSDPRFKDQIIYGDIRWEDEIKFQLSLNKKSEQQALARYGLDYVTDKYLPEKLSEMNII
jgi:DNA topoisomerase-6 subunit A